MQVDMFNRLFASPYYEHQASAIGSGWHANGKTHTTIQRHPMSKVTTIIYNSKETVYPTSITKYVPVGSDVFAQSGVTVTVKYRRGTTGSIQQYTSSLSIN